jgi:hypothetical protein
MSVTAKPISEQVAVYGVFADKTLVEGTIFEQGLCIELSDIEIGDGTLSHYTFCRPGIEGRQLLLMGNGSFLNDGEGESNATVCFCSAPGGRIMYRLKATKGIRAGEEILINYEEEQTWES